MMPNHELQRVLLITGRFPPQYCGIGDYAYQLSIHLTALGHQVTVLTSRGDALKKNDTCNGVMINRGMDGWGISEGKKVFQILDTLGSGCIAHLQYGGFGLRRKPLASFLPLMLRARRTGCRVVVTLHEYRALRLRARLMVAPVLAMAHGVICADSPDVSYLRPWRMRRKLITVFIPVGPTIMPDKDADFPALWRQRLGLRLDRPVVMYFGNIEPWKGFETLLSAMEIVRNRLPGLQFLVVGAFDPGNKWLIRHAASLREKMEAGGVAQGWIKIIDKCPKETVSGCFRAADLAAFPYKMGARANRSAMLSAMAHGVPVVTTFGPHTHPGFERDYGIALVPAGEAEPFAARIHHVLTTPKLQEAMKKRMAAALNRCAWPYIAEQNSALYARLKSPN